MTDTYPDAPRPDERLLLLAQEPDEVPLLSALAQSATVRAVDVGYDRRAHRLVLLLNRYRWEANDGTRVRSALRIDSVGGVQRRHWPTGDDPAVTTLELLAFSQDAGVLTVNFAGGATLRVEIECTDLVLEDISGPWAAGREPRH